MKKSFKFVGMVVLMCVLSGCSVMRENMRGSYQPAIVAPGSTREAIEGQIGWPDKEMKQDDGTTRVIYYASRVDEGRRQNLIGTHMGLDLFTLGFYEFADPFALSEDETKLFVVVYGPDNIARDVSGRCLKCSPLLRG